MPEAGGFVERPAAPGDHDDIRLVNHVEDPTWPRAERKPPRKGKGR